jgi:hypothetical protein
MPRAGRLVEDPLRTRPIVTLSAALAAFALAGCGGSKKTSTGVHYGALGDPCAVPDFLCASPLACIDFRCNSKPTKAGEACSPDTAPCPGGLGCVFGRCATLATSEGAACGPSSPCGTGLYCVAGHCATQLPPGGTCSQPGSAPPIVKETFTLDPALEAKYTAVPPQCVLPVQVPVGSATSIAHLVRTVGSPVNFTVTEPTTALTVVSQEMNQSAPDTFSWGGFNYPNSVVPTNVILPSGTVLYDDSALPGLGADPDAAAWLLAYYGASSVADGSFTVPNTSRAVSDVLASGSLPGGPWSLVTNDYASEFVNGTTGQYDVSVLARTAPLSASGTIDIAVYLVTQSGLTADKMVNDPTMAPRFRQWANSVAFLLGRLGICVGTVHVYDVPASLQALWYSINIDKDKPCDPMMQMFTVSQPIDAVHLFFVDKLTASGLLQGQQLAGIDGTIPGPSLFPGLLNSGAAVALEDFFVNPARPGKTCGPTFNAVDCNLDYLAYISAHETGHWLGLYHDTEADGMLFDPLTDTPTCPCSACVTLAKGQSCGKGSPPPEVDAQACTVSASCSGGDNLMFWLYQDGFSQGTVTSQQGAVVRLNPAVH